MPGWKQARAAFIIRDDAFVVFVFFFVSHCHRPMPSDHKTSHLLTLLFLFRFMQAEVRLFRPSVVLLL
jgi:hypothetical protein